MLELLRGVLESVRIVPAAYEGYRPLIVDGLLFFLGRLPERRLREIFEEQLKLGSELDSNDRISALLRRCPTLHKIAQVVAHDKGLPSDLRIRLQALESMAPTVDFASVQAIVRQELSGTEGVRIAAAALAEGSVAVVVPFTWLVPGRAATSGVFKIVKPGVEGQLLDELAIWPALGSYLQDRCEHYGLPALDFADTLAGVRALLLNEVRLDLEQERLARARRFYAGESGVVVPRVLPLSTPRMTAMEFVDGTKITQSARGPEERRRLARSVIEALLAKPFWSTSADAHFHADPHAGNIMVTHDGRVAVIDWALTTQLTSAQRAAVVRTLLAAATLDAGLAFASLAELGRVIDEARVRAAIGRALVSVRRGAFPGFAWLTGLLDELARSAIVHFPEETALFRKSLLTLLGVAEDVSGEVSVDEVLVRYGMRAFAADLPSRPLAPLQSRAFDSHVSNLDLLTAWAALPLLPARYWVGVWSEVLGTPSGTA